ncbi:MAG TPA: glucose-6-phosphate isomerase [Longimicrobiales bacterium]|nr:glucose-6-phosphate isomerase [Longimicrobiales bacterium]
MTDGPALRLDYGSMLTPRLDGRGLDPRLLADAGERFRAIHDDVAARREAGALGFFELVDRSPMVEQIEAFADGPGQAFENVVVLGIGGSALGTTALLHALRGRDWNERSDEERDHFPRLFVLDNVDPDTIAPLLRRLNLGATLFDVVSKSGTTAETMSQFLIVRDRLRAALGDPDAYRRHFIFTTDPERGVLRRIADEEGIITLPIPGNVGGRFSVLSAVGLLPAAMVGIDLDALLSGAAAMEARCRTAELPENPAGLFAALQYLAHTEAGAGIHVMMPYSDRLYAIADWFRQIWAESLGKRKDLRGKDVWVGPTPVKALGATDQHSQLQLYIEGPFDKTITFLAVDQHDDALPIPPAYPDIDAIAYLGGHSLAGLLDAERRATAAALADSGRMNMTIALPRLDEHALGQLLMMLAIATVHAGGFYGVDPLDQPGVELGKRLTYGLMGRPGADRTEIPEPDPRWVLP